MALVDDFDNVHAVQDMPFKLTGEQVNTINSYLEDIAKEVSAKTEELRQLKENEKTNRFN